MSFINNSKVYIISFPYTHEDKMIELCKDFNTRPQRDKLDLEAREMIAQARRKLKTYIDKNPFNCGLAYQTDCDGVTNPWIAVRALSEDHIINALIETDLFDIQIGVHEHDKVPVRHSKLA